MRSLATWLPWLPLLIAVEIVAEPADEALARATAQYFADRKQFIMENLPLTAQEAKHFWPLYEDFQRDLARLTHRRQRLISEFGASYDDMSDAMAMKLIVERLNYEADRTRLMKEYLYRFGQVLPPKQLVRYYQIEGKIRASVEAGIAEGLPLLK